MFTIQSQSKDFSEESVVRLIDGRVSLEFLGTTRTLEFIAIQISNLVQ